MERKLRFISPDPELAVALSKRKPLVIPQPLYEYFISWCEDVGALMRSREYMVGTVASMITSALASAFRGSRE